MNTERLADLIAKEISGSLTEEEAGALEQARRNHPDLYASLTQKWEHAGKFNLAHIPDTEASWEKFEARIEQTQETVFSRLSPFYKIAAAIVIAVALSVAYFNPWAVEEYITGVGETLEVVLPDASVITLNESSSLTLSGAFNEEERLVEFTGEAYFDIAENPEKPFIIQSGVSEIRVLGTSFNVDAREEGAFVKVDVTSGRVSLSEIGNSTNQVLLTRGMSGQLSRETKLLASSEYRNENFQAWKTRQLNFEDIPMAEVADDFRDFFGENIRFENDAIQSCRFTSFFSQPTVKEVLEVLTLTLDLSYTQTGDGYILQGEGCAEMSE